MNQNRKKIAKDHIKQKRVITIPNSIACLAFEKLASYNFCENVTYRAISLVDHDHPIANSELYPHFSKTDFKFELQT